MQNPCQEFPALITERTRPQDPSRCNRQNGRKQDEMPSTWRAREAAGGGPELTLTQILLKFDRSGRAENLEPRNDPLTYLWSYCGKAAVRQAWFLFSETGNLAKNAENEQDEGKGFSAKQE